MHYIYSNNPEEAVLDLANAIIQALRQGKTLWLICGGSNIPLSVIAMGHIRSNVSPSELANLTIALTDERYGDEGHADSNWKQLMDAGFDVEGLRDALPILFSKSVEETVEEYGERVEAAMDTADQIIAQFGIGLDGHIAGVVPHSVGVKDPKPVCAHTDPLFTRISLTLESLLRIDEAYMYAFGESKHDIINRLRNETLPLIEMPSQILKQLPEATVYSDQFPE